MLRAQCNLTCSAYSEHVYSCDERQDTSYFHTALLRLALPALKAHLHLSFCSHAYSGNNKAPWHDVFYRNLALNKYAYVTIALLVSKEKPPPRQGLNWCYLQIKRRGFRRFPRDPIRQTNSAHGPYSEHFLYQSHHPSMCSWLYARSASCHLEHQ